MTPLQLAATLAATLLGALLIGGLSCVCAQFLGRGSKHDDLEIDRG